MTSLICAACQAELSLKPLNPKGFENSMLEVLGIGYLEAALKLEAILNANLGIKKILFTGTAGAYSKNLEIGEFVDVGLSALLNLGTVQGLSYTIKDTYPLYKSNSTNSNILCLSSLEITQDDNCSKLILDYYLGLDCFARAHNDRLILVENMELYGIAKVANAHQIPWSALLRITNYTNKNAHKDYLQQM